MSISAELQEAAILMGARAYVRACHSDYEPGEPLSKEDEDMAGRLATYTHSGSNAVRSVAIAVLEFMELRSPDACPQCSSYKHSCYVCFGDTDHWHEVTRVRCAACIEANI